MSGFNECDFIELENRGRPAAATRQRTSESFRKELRNAHMTFVCKIYIIAVCLVAVGTTQWLAIVTLNSTRAAKFVKQWNFAMPALIFLNFLMMTLMHAILRSKRLNRKLGVVVYIFVTMEVSSATLVKSLTQSTTWQLFKAAALTLTIFGLSWISALIYHFEMEKDQLYLTMWSIRFFLMISICLLLTLTFDSLHMVISITLLLVFCITIFLIISGRSLGSQEFYREESSYLSLYITLAYLNSLSLLASSLVFFQNLEMLQNLALS